MEVSLYNNGLSNGYTSSASYGLHNLTDFLYEADVSMDGPATGYINYSGLVIRGSPTFDEFNDWNDGYYFSIARINVSTDVKLGCFTAHKIVEGVWTSLTGNTLYCYNFINYYNSNTMKVYAKGTKLNFYINNYLVLSKSINGPACGRVGVFSYDYFERKTRVSWATAGLAILPTASFSPGMPAQYYNFDLNGLSLITKPSLFDQ